MNGVHQLGHQLIDQFTGNGEVFDFEVLVFVAWFKHYIETAIAFVTNAKLGAQTEMQWGAGVYVQLGQCFWGGQLLELLLNTKLLTPE